MTDECQTKLNDILKLSEGFWMEQSLFHERVGRVPARQPGETGNRQSGVPDQEAHCSTWGLRTRDHCCLAAVISTSLSGYRA